MGVQIEKQLGVIFSNVKKKSIVCFDIKLQMKFYFYNYVHILETNCFLNCLQNFVQKFEDSNFQIIQTHGVSYNTRTYI